MKNGRAVRKKISAAKQVRKLRSKNEHLSSRGSLPCRNGSSALRMPIPNHVRTARKRCDTEPEGHERNTNKWISEIQQQLAANQSINHSIDQPLDQSISITINQCIFLFLYLKKMFENPGDFRRSNPLLRTNQRFFPVLNLHQTSLNLLVIRNRSISEALKFEPGK